MSDAPDPEALAAAHSARLYQHGVALSDLGDLKANQVVVEAVMPPGRVASIHLPGSAKDILPTTAIAYRVLRRADGDLVDEPENGFYADTAVPLDDGVLVLLRNAMLEPLHPNAKLFMIHRKHILATVAG